MKLIKFSENDTLVMKKKHPCGADTFSVLRAGSDIKLKCCACGRIVTVPREKIEGNVKKVISEFNNGRTE